MTSLCFQLRISLLLYVGLSHKLVREISIVHIITFRLHKISCDLVGNHDILGQMQGKWILFIYRLISPFITPSIIDRITSILVVVKKGTSGCIGITSSISSNLHISFISNLIELKSALAKSDWWSASVFQHDMLFDKLGLWQNGGNLPV